MSDSTQAEGESLGQIHSLSASPAWWRDGAENKDRAKHFMVARDLPSRPYWKVGSGTYPGTVEGAGFVWLKFRVLWKSQVVDRALQAPSMRWEGRGGIGHGWVLPLWSGLVNGLEASKKVHSLRLMVPSTTYFSCKTLRVCYFSPASLQCNAWSKQKCAVNILTLVWTWVAGGTLLIEAVHKNRG